MNTYSDVLDILIEDNSHLVDEFLDIFDVSDNSIMTEMSDAQKEAVTKWLADNMVSNELLENSEEADIPAHILDMARTAYENHGVAQHINLDGGKYSVSDFYDYDTTVKSFGVDLYESKEDIATAVTEIYGSLEDAQEAYKKDKQSFYKEVVSYVSGNKDEIFPLIDEMFNVSENLSESDMNHIYATSNNVSIDMELGLSLLEECHSALMPKILDNIHQGVTIIDSDIANEILGIMSSDKNIEASKSLLSMRDDSALSFLTKCSNIVLNKMYDGKVSSIDIVKEIFRFLNVYYRYTTKIQDLSPDGGKKTICDVNLLNAIRATYSISEISANGETVLVDMYSGDIIARFDSNTNVATIFYENIFDKYRLIDLSFLSSVNSLLMTTGVTTDINKILSDIKVNTDNMLLRIYLDSELESQISMEIISELEPSISEIIQSYNNHDVVDSIGGIKVALVESISDGYRSLTLEPTSIYERDKLKAINPQMFMKDASAVVGGVALSETSYDISKKSAVSTEDVMNAIGITKNDAVQIVEVLNDKYQIGSEFADKEKTLETLFESKSLKGKDKVWKLHESVDAPIQTYADMIVYNEAGDVLLLQRNTDCDFEPNKWGFAGGKVQIGETTEDGAIRECLEEAGIQCDGVSKIGEYVNADGSVSHYYTCVSNADAIISDECQNFTWVAPEQVPDFDLILGNTNNRFEKVLNLPISVNESKISDILRDLSKGDVADIIGLISSPKRYAKASVSRVVLDKLNKSGVVGDKATNIADKVLKFYPATVGVFSFIDNLLESDDRVNDLQTRIQELENDANASDVEKKELKLELQELKLYKYEEEIKKLSIRLEAVEKEEREETDDDKKEKLNKEKEEIIAKQKTISEKMENLKTKITSTKSAIDNAGAELDTLLDDPFSKIQ